MIIDVTEEEFFMLLSLRAMGEKVFKEFGVMVDASFIALQKAHILEGKRIMAEWYEQQEKQRTYDTFTNAADNKKARLLQRPYKSHGQILKEFRLNVCSSASHKRETLDH